MILSSIQSLYAISANVRQAKTMTKTEGGRLEWRSASRWMPPLGLGGS